MIPFDPNQLRLLSPELEQGLCAILLLALSVRPDGGGPWSQGLAIQSMMERFWYHWRVAGAPVKQSAIAYSIAHLIWASAHAE